MLKIDSAGSSITVMCKLAAARKYKQVTPFSIYLKCLHITLLFSKSSHKSTHFGMTDTLRGALECSFSLQLALSITTTFAVHMY